MLALFPLNTVLFPGCRLDLQIFEPRYLDMVSRCLRHGQNFGVLSLLEGAEIGAQEQQVAGVGCEASIRDWQQLPNGLLGIRVEGVRRFVLERSERQGDGLLLGQVRYLESCAEEPLSAEHEELQQLALLLAQHPHMSALGSAELAGLRDLSYRLGYLLPFTRGQKLQLLAQDNPQRCLQWLQQWLAELQGEV